MINRVSKGEGRAGPFSGLKSGATGARLALFATVIVVLGCGGCRKPGANESEPGGLSLEPKSYKQAKIAFVSDRDGNEEIYVMNADGTLQKNVTRHPGDDRWPCWSPDGTKIAFTSFRDGNQEIYVMNADGTQQTNLTKNPAPDLDPSWSPDGRTIAFCSYRGTDGNPEICVMSSNGTRQRTLTDNLAIDWHPCWSPDGTKIAFASNRRGNFDIYVMNRDGSEQRSLTYSVNDQLEPCWSPDGQKIAFVSYGITDATKRLQLGRPTPCDIYVMNADGTEQKNLTNSWFADDRTPSWSPDGKKIAFGSGRQQSGEVYVINADGSEETNVTVNAAMDFCPSWSPFLPSQIQR